MAVVDVRLLALAVSLGAASALTPGPLLVLGVGATLERGFLAGLRIAIAPLLTDAPILALGLLTLGTLPRMVLGGLGLAGGLFLVVLGGRKAWGAPRAQLPPVDAAGPGGNDRGDVLRGVTVNLLNPNAWLFVLTVIAPLVALTWPRSRASAVGFVVVFYVFLVGGRVALTAGLAVLRSRLSLRAFRGLLLVAGLLLAAIGASLAWQGWDRLIAAK
jgi:threonine/homoserine/homoserine lactone efflux protein